MIFVDRNFRLPRIWSNLELKKFAHLFDGDIVNVSGWKDEDKEGNFYSKYFKNAKSYTITNYETEACGFQGMENEIFLDLEKTVTDDLVGKFDVVFNHTVLEHVFEIEQAFANLCKMTKDVAIIVVPHLQQMHAVYGDYWRFTPLSLKKLFEKNQMHLQYLSFNSHKNSSVYLFAIAVKDKEKWKDLIPSQFDYKDPNPLEKNFDQYVGCNAIYNPWYKIIQKLARFLNLTN